MQWSNSDKRYGLTAILLHWFMAMMIMALLVLGLTMVAMEDSDEKWQLYSLHKSVGMLVVVLAAGRLLWRLRSVIPPLPETLKPIEKFLAHLTHALLYAVLFLLPASGYIDSSAGDYKLQFFGLFDIPKLIAKSKAVEDAALVFHSALGYLLIVMLVLHLGAVLKHHLILKDGTLKRMLP